MKDNSQDTVGDSGAGPVPLRELAEDCAKGEMHTSELRAQLFRLRKHVFVGAPRHG